MTESTTNQLRVSATDILSGFVAGLPHTVRPCLCHMNSLWLRFLAYNLGIRAMPILLSFFVKSKFPKACKVLSTLCGMHYAFIN